MAAGTHIRLTSVEVDAEPAGFQAVLQTLRRAFSALRVPLGALTAALLVFGVFMAVIGRNPLEIYQQMFRGSFGTWFSFQNTLLRAAPLMLTALATALPGRLGLVVLGGEGGLVLGGLAAAVAGAAMKSHGHGPLAVATATLVVGALVGGAWVALGGALRAYRGVNETIATLLLNYIAIALLNHFVEGPLRDPASLNKPSTLPIGDENMIGSIPGLDVHWGLAWGLGACLLGWFVMQRTLFGFSARMIGGNVRTALLNGLPVARLIVLATFLGGLCAGLAGALEVAAIHGTANASLVTGYGYTGVLVAFIARQNPLAVIPVSIVIGGIGASGGLLQRGFDLPDATVNVLQGILFIAILLSETLHGRAKVTKIKKTKAIPVSTGEVAA
ncbi:MAG TPA: ABC transporter permease [Polyangia bacterium]|jgi:simple sugar transport system permease protein|nr:ABC transporter permease [Polyangia bacterium]